MKPTSAQILFFHALESAGFGLVAAVIAGVYQYVNTSGLHWQGIAATGGLIAVGHLTTAYKSLLADPSLTPAISDTLNEVKTEVQTHTPLLNTLVNFLTQPPAPTLASQQPPPVVQQPVAQLDFPPLPTISMPMAAIPSAPQPPKG